MKMVVSFKLKGELAELVRREKGWAAFLLATRLSLLTLVFGYGFWLLALWYLSVPLPRHTTNVVHWLLIGHALFWWLLPLSSLGATRYSLTRLGIGDKRWANWVGHSIEVHPLSDKHLVLKLWNKDRVRASTVSLPNEERLQRLIVRYVGRFVPPLERHPDEHAIRIKPPDVPVWFVPLAIALAIVHGVVLGGLVLLMKKRLGLTGETLKLLLVVGSFFHTAWVPAWLLARTERYRRIRSRLYVTAGVMVFVSMIVAMATALVLMI